MELLFIFLILIFGINIFQFAYLPFTNLAEGMGYDGIWYYKSANEFWPKTDNYHLFRQLPSTFVYFIKKIIYRPYDYYNTAKAFQVYNLICNGLSVFFTYLICRKLHLGNLKSSLFFGFVFLNFHILKDSVYNPVMTDSSVLLFSICLLYSFLSMNRILYFLFSACLLFSFPVGGFLLQIIYMFWDKNFKNHDLPYVKKVHFLPLIVSICYCLISMFIVLFMKRDTVMTFPDSINLYLYPVSLLISAIVIFHVLKIHSKVLKFIFLSFRNINITNKFYLFVFLFDLFIFLILPKLNRNPSVGLTSVFTLSPFIIINLKPLIGFFDNIMYFGPVVVLYFLNLKKRAEKYHNSAAPQLLSLFVFAFALKPEARHSIFLLPLIAFYLVQELPSNFWNPKQIFTISVICLLFSKFWYPCHWAIFPPGYEIFTSKVNHAIFQEFPIQHYFMFQGPMISHQNYFLWLLAIIPLVWYCRKMLIAGNGEPSANSN